MSLTRLVLCAIAFTLGIQGSYGQNPRPRYAPSRPTVSPWLYLSTPDTAGIPNYFAFVRPLQRQTQVNQMQQSRLQLQQNEIQSVESQLQLRQSTTAITGTNSTFMNHGQYFMPATGNTNMQRK